jgi:hypothetical protein
MSTNPSNIQNDITSRKTLLLDGQKNIEFEFNRVSKSREYDDIIIQIYNREYNEIYGKVNNPLFIRDNVLYSYYKTNDAEYIKIIDAIGQYIAKLYDLKLVGHQ